MTNETLKKLVMAASVIVVIMMFVAMSLTVLYVKENVYDVNYNETHHCYSFGAEVECK